MTQVPQRIWNQIAHEQDLKTEWAKRMFNLKREQIDKALDEEANKVMEEGYNDRAVGAAITVVPMMLENEAIQGYISDHNAAGLMGALPAVPDRKTAVLIMKKDAMLSKDQVSQLDKVLKRYQDLQS